MSKMTPEEYLSQLHIIQNNNPPTYAILPRAEKIYGIDVNTRTVEAPRNLGVLTDNNSDTIYFAINRFVDYMDLVETCCVINYINAEGKSGFYSVPFYDIHTLKNEQKILIPWFVDEFVTRKKGRVYFAIQFYVTERIQDSEDVNKAIIQFAYNFNTKPAYSEVLESLKMGETIGKEDVEIPINYNDYQLFYDLNQRMVRLENHARNDYFTYWTILD